METDEYWQEHDASTYGTVQLAPKAHWLLCQVLPPPGAQPDVLVPQQGASLACISSQGSAPMAPRRLVFFSNVLVSPSLTSPSHTSFMASSSHTLPLPLPCHPDTQTSCPCHPWHCHHANIHPVYMLLHANCQLPCHTTMSTMPCHLPYNAPFPCPAKLPLMPTANLC